jgi:hypothetical protein
MHTLAQSAYLDSSFGVDEELPRAGSALENPYVFDASARELKVMAAKGLVDIVEERTTRVAGEVLIDRLRFRRIH